MIASLVRRFGDIDVAEEAAGEALVVALARWPVEGTPPNPAAGRRRPPDAGRSTGSAGSSGATTSIRRPG